MYAHIFLLFITISISNAGYQLNDCKVHNIIIESPYHDCWVPVDWQIVASYPEDTLSIYGQKNEEQELYFTRCSNENCTGDCYVIEETIKFTNYCMPRQGNDSYISWLLDDAEYYSAFDTVRWLGVSYDHPCNSQCYCNSSSYCVGCYDGYWGDDCSETCTCTDQTNGYCDRYNGTCMCYLGHTLSASTNICEIDKCNHRCDCDDNGDCQLCFAGWWGPDCQMDCSEDCEIGTCDFENGDCDEGDDATYSTCSVSDWGDWSTCSAQCNGGIRYRTRSVEYVYPVDINCPDTAEYETCNAQSCPVLKFDMSGELEDDTETSITSALSEYVDSTIRYTILTSQTSGSLFTVQVLFYYDSAATEFTYSTVVGYLEAGVLSTVESNTGKTVEEDSIYLNGVNLFQDGEDIYLTAVIFLDNTTCTDSQTLVEARLTIAKKDYERDNSASLTVSVDTCTDLTSGEAEMVIQLKIDPDMDSMSEVTADNEIEGNEEAALSFLDYFSTNSDGLSFMEEDVGVDITVMGKVEVKTTEYNSTEDSSSSCTTSSTSSTSNGAVVGLAIAVIILTIASASFFAMWWKQATPIPTGDYVYSRM